jgi:hypothetical protein
MDDSYLEHYYVIINAVQYGPFTNCSAPVFSEDGRNWGYLYSKKTDEITVVINKTEFGPYATDKCYKFKYTPDLSGWCLVTQEPAGEKGYIHNIIINGQIKESFTIDFPFDGYNKFDGNYYSFFTIYHDLLSYMYICSESPAGYYLKTKDNRYGPFNLCRVYISKNGESWAYRYTNALDEEFVVIKNKVFGPFRLATDVVFSDDGTKWMFSCLDLASRMYYLNFTGKLFGPFEAKSEEFIFSPDSKRWACRINDTTFLVDGTIVGPYNSSTVMRYLSAFSGDSSTWGALVATTDKLYVLLNTKLIPTPFGGSASSLVALSPNGKRWAYPAANCSVVVDNKLYGPFSSDRELEFGLIKFSHSGKTWSTCLGLPLDVISSEFSSWEGNRLQDDILIINGIAYLERTPFCFPKAMTKQNERNIIVTIENGCLKIYKLE